MLEPSKCIKFLHFFADFIFSLSSFTVPKLIEDASQPQPKRRGDIHESTL